MNYFANKRKSLFPYGATEKHPSIFLTPRVVKFLYQLEFEITLIIN